MNRSLRVAIIGAGAAGLTAAHELSALGYKNLTVYERNHRIGGKVYSVYKSGASLELGALWAGTSYHFVLDLAERYGVSVSEEDCDLMLWQGQNFQPMEESFFKGERRLSMPVALVNANVTFLRYQKDIAKIGFASIDPALCEDFAGFASRHHFNAVAEAFRPFWLGCGYSDYNVTPAIYVLKLLAPIIQNSIQTLLSTRSWDQLTAGMLWFPTGYSSVFERIAASLPDVRLGTGVTSVERCYDKDHWTLKIKAGGRVDEFDRVIIAVDPRSAMQILDASDEEHSLFDHVESHPYRMYLVSATHETLAANKVLLREDLPQSLEKPTVVSALQRQGSAPRWIVGQLGGDFGDADQAAASMLADRKSLGFNAVHIEHVAEWNYFPRVSSPDLLGGYFDRFEALQGQRGTYFVGSLLSSETVEHTAAYAHQLVETFFG